GFKRILIGPSDKVSIEVRNDLNPYLARIIIADEWDGDPEEAKKLLENVQNAWPTGNKVKFLLTCGGFIQFNWPEELSRNEIGDAINPTKESVEVLINEAEKYVKFVLSGGVEGKIKTTY
ncbi:MAG: hypothetical protein ACP5ER_06705, partial [Candidatus Bathyarchaeales archaeon]